MSEQNRRSVRIDRSAAFHVNALGVRCDPFPLTFSLTTAGELRTIAATAAGATELSDVLAALGQAYAVVLNVGTNSFLDDDLQQWPLSRIAREQGVDAVAYDIRWAASRYWSDDLLVLPWAELDRLLAGWSSYDIEILDAPGPLSPGTADEVALAVNSQDLTTAMVPAVPGATLYYSGHDDCYVHLETTDPTAPLRVLTRLLALKAGAVLLAEDEHVGTVTVVEPPADLVTGLLARSDHWLGSVARTSPTGVTVSLAVRDRSWRLGDPVPELLPYRLTLDVPRGTWVAAESGPGC
ncbi:hypothetical protein MRQ36_31930 [Micromonospora sp. R77]|uniref:hypothetical protein n=1 Tax=Micromonospora sp. R77 TaxID=2925836 RepID=UPI001F618E14|nr:hypothetical protein [Micromonospora sp. R77]MCI4066924.1 hypothetical protein [Micromonospora sp. R77]